MWLSYGCAVHCALMPFFLGYLAMNGFGWIGESSTEWLIIISSLSLALLRLSYSYMFEHKRPEPVVYFLIGASLIFLAKSVFFEAPAGVEPVGMVAGGLMIGTAHFRNRAQSKCGAPHLFGTCSHG